MPMTPNRRSIYKPRYQRPESKWVCGKAAEGCSCPPGPSSQGRCAGYECIPAEVGDRWVCTRPDQYGGPCNSASLNTPDFGPIVTDGVAKCCRETHCAPTLSTRAKRGNLTWILLGASICTILTLLGGPWRNKLMTPGPLTTAHQGASYASQETDSSGILAENCNACHDAFERGFLSSIRTTFDKSAVTPQSKKCLECHSTIADAPLNTHGIPSSKLEWLTETSNAIGPTTNATTLPLTLARLVSGPIIDHDNQLACAACHQEHNGQRFDLKQMSQDQCQSCHVQRFKSFNSGHPDFGQIGGSVSNNFPYDRRTHIVFDHESHLQKHFLESKLPGAGETSCTDCHIFSQTNPLPQTKTFSTMCATCHGDDIVRAPDNPFHLYGLPQLQTEILDEENRSIENWPEIYQERVLSPFLLMFISGDEEYRKGGRKATQIQFESDLEVLDEIFLRELFALDAFEEESELDAVQRAAQSILRLNSAVVEKQTESVLIARLKNMQPHERRDNFDYDAMLGLLAKPQSIGKTIDAIAKTDIIVNKGAYTTEDGKASSSSWTTKLERVSQFTKFNEALDELDEDLGADFVKWLTSFDSFKSWFDSTVVINGKNWYMATTNKKISSSAWKKVIKTAPGFESLDGAKETSAAKATKDFQSWISSQSKFKKWLEAEYRITPEAWYPTESPRSIFYRPMDHADPFIKEWLDYSASLYFENAAARLLFDELSGRQAPDSSPGTCIKCHSVDHVIDLENTSTLLVNWGLPETERSFTKFDHSPHLKLLDCATCHDYVSTPAAEGESKFSYKDSFRASDKDGKVSGKLGTDFLTFKSSFQPLTQEDCAKCHTAEKAGNSCLICHNYHIQDLTSFSSSNLFK